MIRIIDYGMGNLRSVQKALEAVGACAEITSDPDRVRTADKLILPGVGAFGDAIAVLRSTGLGEAFVEAARAGKPCLGVCLGMQLLFDASEEDGEHEGLRLLRGRVVRLRPPENLRLKVPHMGWNTLHMRRASPLLRGIEAESWLYFVHSYHALVCLDEDVTATTEYGGPVVAMVGRENLAACQFHPEKSQSVGLAMYANFAAL